jgi:MATE family multidrug resistance protein
MHAPMTYTAHMKAALVLGLPLAGSHLAQFAIHLTDTVMLGWYDVQALAAVVLAANLFFILFTLGSGFAWAVMPMVAAASEAGDETRARRITRMGLWISVSVAVLVMPAMWFAAPLMRLLGQEPELAEMVQEYLRIAGWGMFPALMVMVLKSHLAALEHTRVVLWATVLAALVNAGIDYLLIFGRWGLPEMGLKGAALASLATQLASFAALVVYAQRVLPRHRLFRRLWRPDREALGEVTRMGWQIGLTSVAEVGLFTAATLLMGWIGTVALATHGIAIEIAALVFMLHMGLSNAATVRAGRALGRGDEAGLRRGAAAVLLLSLMISISAVVLFLTMPDRLIGLFLGPDEPLRAEIIAAGRKLLAVAALFQLVDAAQVMALGLLRGVHDTKVPMLYATIAYWLVGIPLSYVLGIQLGLGGVGVWLGLVAGLSVAGVLLMARFWLRSSRIAPV